MLNLLLRFFLALVFFFCEGSEKHHEISPRRGRGLYDSRIFWNTHLGGGSGGGAGAGARASAADGAATAAAWSPVARRTTGAAPSRSSSAASCCPVADYNQHTTVDRKKPGAGRRVGKALALLMVFQASTGYGSHDRITILPAISHSWA